MTSARILLTREQRNMLRREIVLAISGDAIGDFLDRPDHLDWALERRRVHELAFALLDDLGWSPEADRDTYELRCHAQLADWLTHQLDQEKQELTREHDVLARIRAGEPGLLWPQQSPVDVEHEIRASTDEALDRMNLFRTLLASAGHP